MFVALPSDARRSLRGQPRRGLACQRVLAGVQADRGTFWADPEVGRRTARAIRPNCLRRSSPPRPGGGTLDARPRWAVQRVGRSCGGETLREWEVSPCGGPRAPAVPGNRLTACVDVVRLRRRHLPVVFPTRESDRTSRGVGDRLDNPGRRAARNVLHIHPKRGTGKPSWSIRAGEPIYAIRRRLRVPESLCPGSADGPEARPGDASWL